MMGYVVSTVAPMLTMYFGGGLEYKVSALRCLCCRFGCSLSTISVVGSVSIYITVIIMKVTGIPYRTRRESLTFLII
jgi:hypothetical protein